jgi:hypothetical protein
MLTLVQHFFKDASEFLERGIGFCAAVSIQQRPARGNPLW